MRRVIVFLALAGVLPFIPLAPAKAEIVYPFCLRQYEGFGRVGMEDCSYRTFAQCMASASGRSATCMENPAWLARPVQKTHKRVVVR